MGRYDITCYRFIEKILIQSILGTAATAGTGYTFNFDENTKDVDLLNKKTDLYDNQVTRIPMDKVVRDLSSRVGDMKLQDPTDTNCSSDSDNQSIISLSESNSSKSNTSTTSFLLKP